MRVARTASAISGQGASGGKSGGSVKLTVSVPESNEQSGDSTGSHPFAVDTQSLSSAPVMSTPSPRSSSSPKRRVPPARSSNGVEKMALASNASPGGGAAMPAVASPRRPSGPGLMRCSVIPPFSGRHIRASRSTAPVTASGASVAKAMPRPFASFPAGSRVPFAKVGRVPGFGSTATSMRSGRAWAGAAWSNSCW